MVFLKSVSTWGCSHSDRLQPICRDISVSSKYIPSLHLLWLPPQVPLFLTSSFNLMSHQKDWVTEFYLARTSEAVFWSYLILLTFIKQIPGDVHAPSAMPRNRIIKKKTKKAKQATVPAFIELPGWNTQVAACPDYAGELWGSLKGLLSSALNLGARKGSLRKQAKLRALGEAGVKQEQNGEWYSKRLMSDLVL